MKNKFVYKLLFIFLILFFVLSSCSYASSSALTLDSKAAVLMDFNSGKMLYEKNINEKIYPASITKVLTAILTVENCNLSDVVTISNSAISGVEYGYVTANLKAGEELTVEELLNVLLVASANDAALVLAEHVGGSMDNFVSMMNQKAEEIGCTNTNFVNPNGVHDDNHYSTVHDLALIGQYAMQFDIIKEISSKTHYELGSTNKYSKDDRVFYTTNDMLVSSNKNYYKYAIGIKTGFTTPAGHCLMSYSEDDELSFICVAVGASTSDNRYSDVKNLFKYGYDNYYLKKIGNAGYAVQTVEIKNATESTKKLNLLLEKDINITMNKDNTEFTTDISLLEEKLQAPIFKGDIIGSVTYTYDGMSYTSNLIASHDVEPSRMFIYFVLLFNFLMIFFIVKKLIKVYKQKNRLNIYNEKRPKKLFK